MFQGCLSAWHRAWAGEGWREGGREEGRKEEKERREGGRKRGREGQALHPGEQKLGGQGLKLAEEADKGM